jgi:DNA-directed RNA polymerase II subunit RPB3
MNPTIKDVLTENNILKFTLSHINMSLANALRRVILSEIPTLAFITEFHETNQCNISVNTSRLHNEIIKHRLSCVPIHIKVNQTGEETDPLTGKYILEVDVSNDTDNMIYVTTEHFKIKNKTNGHYLTEEETRKIFPKNEITQSYIDLCRLRPAISDTIPGEQLRLTCEFSVSTAKENSVYNVVSKCAYSNTVDIIKKNEIWEKHKTELLGMDGITQQEIEFQRKNFELLDAQRYFVPDSFDFMIQTVGVYENNEIVKRGCLTLQHKFIDLIKQIDSDIVPIHRSETTMENCFDITLENEDYTMGKAIEYVLHEEFFKKEKKLVYCGFKKFHPHDTHSIIRIAFKENLDKTEARQVLRTACVMIQDVFKKIYAMF